ncbi:MAG: HAMP domain-containing protein [Clostridium sp.]|nr:HAMP domain-containing protein [Clostridium sp.]
MKKLSIKMRVTLWYTGILVLLSGLALAVLLSASNRYIRNNVKSRLEDRVFSSFREIEWDRKDGRLEIDDDLNIFQNEVWLGIYDSLGYPLFGQAPGNFPDGIVFRDGIQQVIRDGGSVWHVYDSHLDVPGYGTLWIRGVSSQTDSEEAFAAISRIALVLFPFLAVLAAVGGYLITRRAFLPVSQMSATARRIRTGGDLSQRIGLDKGKDELHQLAGAFDEMLEQLEQQFEKEKRFTSDVSHELRTPISVIISQCEYALEQAPQEGQERDSLCSILEQARRMARLVSQLLTLSRADNGARQLQLETVNLSELCEMVTLELEEAAQQKKITISLKIQPDILMRADETLMMRLLINLISNGITYGREGGHIEVGLSSGETGIRGYVKDDGIGIAPDCLDHVWERFYQVDPSRTAEKGRGAGLGLSMVKWIVSAHGGSICAESALGEGSCFSFTFPS